MLDPRKIITTSWVFESVWLCFDFAFEDLGSSIEDLLYGLCTFSHDTNFHQPKGPFSSVA